MHSFKKHRVKTEKQEVSASGSASNSDYDLTYFIHDRVELMHQVFSVLKPKDLKTMAPECVRHISTDDLQELCTEELLGISSKRLCAILDGAEPPSDTESSSESPERFETISLDSISSDEEILSEASSKKNKKHRHHHRNSTKSKRKKSRTSPEKEDQEQSRAARAGLTVLELLELQARARAIRAQLQQEQAAKQGAPVEPVVSSQESSDNEVEIKEEPAEVVEISSEDEKPDIGKLAAKSATALQTSESAQVVTKRINDLIITVPQTKQSRKIKLNRSKLTVVDKSDAAASCSSKTVNNTVNTSTSDNKNSKDKNKSNNKDKSSDTNKANDKNSTNDESNGNNKNSCNEQSTNNAANKNNDKEAKKIGDKTKKKQKKKGKKETDKDSDQDEITLQLSDTEKMDLLEDLDRKNFEKVSSSGSEDSESSSSDSTDDELDKNKSKTKVLEVQTSETNTNNDKEKDVFEYVKASSPKSSDDVEFLPNNETSKDNSKNDDNPNTSANDEIVDTTDKNNTELATTEVNNKEIEENSTKSPVNNVIVETIDDIPIMNEEEQESKSDSGSKENNSEINATDSVDVENKATEANTVNVNDENKETQKKITEREKSEGEISEKSNSEVEALDLEPEIVCISDTEEQDVNKKRDKKKKKKEKKSKNKKSKKSDFRESGDQNFFEEAKQVDVDVDKTDITENITKIEEILTNVSISDKDNDDVYEILELSDDSSCYEVEGTVLSKEPTSEEIEALSAKIDDLEREDVVTEEEIREYEEKLKNQNNVSDNTENISWKDRYLGSKKVKNVLTTSNIFNALRKKNIELKKKLEESKKKEEAEKLAEEVKEPEIVPTLEEGSMEHFNTLQGSTMYVDPVPDTIEKTNESDKAAENNEETDSGEVGKDEAQRKTQAVNEMRKDAKQILKMYKKLLKYNDINKKKDPNKQKDPNRKKKKKKKSKDGAKEGVSAINK